MNVDVVLTEDDPKLGRRGQVVKVSPGFAQNFLFPQGKARPATKGNLKAFEIEKSRRARDEASRAERAHALAARLKDFSLTIEMAAGEGEKLFGAVTSQDIAEALSRAGVDVDRREIHLEIGRASCRERVYVLV